MSKPITLLVIGSNIKLDQFMHAADLFERWKVLVEFPPIEISGTLASGGTIASAIAKTKTALESSGEFRVVAIFHPYIEEGAWCDREIIIVSDGFKWCKFYEFLKSYNYVGPMPRRYLDEQLSPQPATSKE